MLWTWWIWEGTAHGLAAFVMIRFSMIGYREHGYLYQVGKGNRSLQHAIDVLLPFIKAASSRTRKYRNWLRTNLSRVGKHHSEDVYRFMAGQVLITALIVLSSYIMLCVLLGLPLWVPGLFGIISFIVPALKLRDKALARSRSASRDLPFFIDYMTLAMDAGLDFGRALSVVVEDATDSHLKEEFIHLQRDLRLGLSREEGLAALQNRLGSPDIRQFCQTMIQALRMGSNVTHTLKAISETLLTKRFQLAEETAGKISVRMMIPMLVFVIPSAMIILLGPLMLEWFTNM